MKTSTNRVKTSRIEIRLKDHEKKLIQMLSIEDDKTMTDFLMHCVYYYINSKQNEIREIKKFYYDKL